MKALRLATALSAAVLTAALAGPAVADTRDRVLPPTDEAAASAARQTVAGKIWSGKLTIDKQIFDAAFTLSDSGRGQLKVIDPTGGQPEEMTLVWGVVQAEPGGKARIALVLVADEDGGLDADDDVMSLTGAVAGARFTGTFDYEGVTAPVELTAQ